MTIDFGTLIGLIGIAIAVFFGLRIFTGSIGKKLEAIKEKVNNIEHTANDVWAVIRAKFVESEGTIEVQLPNFGITRISAEPGPRDTEYTLQISSHKLSSKYIAKLSLEKNLKIDNELITLNEYEGRLFKDEVNVTSLGPRVLKIRVPCIEARICTEYINTFLKWLDTIYFAAIPKVDDFEKSIKF